MLHKTIKALLPTSLWLLVLGIHPEESPDFDQLPTICMREIKRGGTMPCHAWIPPGPMLSTSTSESGDGLLPTPHRPSCSHRDYNKETIPPFQVARPSSGNPESLFGLFPAPASSDLTQGNTTIILPGAQRPRVTGDIACTQ
ncbi:unnamed protein product [Calypogeia fissa]